MTTTTSNAADSITDIIVNRAIDGGIEVTMWSDVFAPQTRYRIEFLAERYQVMQYFSEGGWDTTRSFKSLRSAAREMIIRLGVNNLAAEMRADEAMAVAGTAARQEALLGTERSRVPCFVECECRYCGGPTGMGLWEVDYKAFDEMPGEEYSEPQNVGWGEADIQRPLFRVRIKTRYSCCPGCRSYEY